MKKKVLALVLALVMTLTLLPVTAMADGGGASTTYTVTFDANGATGPVPTQADTAEGGKFKLPGAGDLEKHGYAFYGWKIGDTIYQANETYTMPAENVTFTAHWLRKPTVEINSFSVLDDIVTGIRTLEINYTLTNRHTEEMTYDLWWRLATSTNGKIVAEKGPTHTLAGGEVYSGTLLAVIPANKAADVILHAAQLRLHVRNEGSSSGSGDLTYFVLKTVQANIHQGTYVTLDANGGLYNGETTTKLFVDTSLEYGTYGAFEWVDESLYSREGYTFKGYARTADATTPEHADDALKDVVWNPADPVTTWYAIWAPNQYTVTFNANGGTGNMTNQTFVYDAAAQPLSTNTFTKTGYTFIGWATSPTATEGKYEDNEPVSNLATSGNVELYAVWTPNQVSTLPAQAKYFVEHYVEKWDGSYKLVETEILSGEIGTIVTADSTKYDDNTHHVNTTASILNGEVTFDLFAADPMSSLLTLKVYYDISPYYGSVDTTPETEIVTPKTADAGIFLAVSMSILSVTGSAVLLKKKED